MHGVQYLHSGTVNIVNVVYSEQEMQCISPKNKGLVTKEIAEI